MKKLFFVLALLVSMSAVSYGEETNIITPVITDKNAQYIPEGKATGNEIITLHLPSLIDEEEGNQEEENSAPKTPAKSYSNVTVYGIPMNSIPVILNESTEVIYQIAVPAETVRTKPLEIAYVTPDQRPVYIYVTAGAAERVKDCAVDKENSPYIELDGDPVNNSICVMAASLPSFIVKKLEQEKDKGLSLDNQAKDVMKNGNWDISYLYSVIVGPYGKTEVSREDQKKAKDNALLETVFVMFDVPEEYSDMTFYGYPLMDTAMYLPVPVSVIKNERPEITFTDGEGQHVKCILSEETKAGMNEIINSDVALLISLSFDEEGIMWSSIYPLENELADKVDTSRTEFDFVESIGNVTKESIRLREDDNFLDSQVTFWEGE